MSAGANGNVKRRAALWVAIVALLSASLGGVGGYLFAAHSHADVKPVLSDDARRAQKVALLTDELKLTADQQKQLDDTIRDAQAKFKAIRDASQPQIDATRAQAWQKVRGFLTAEQLPKYEAYLVKLDEERKRNGMQ